MGMFSELCITGTSAICGQFMAVFSSLSLFFKKGINKRLLLFSILPWLGVNLEIFMGVKQSKVTPFFFVFARVSFN
jgi:hypothetical protein